MFVIKGKRGSAKSEAFGWSRQAEQSSAGSRKLSSNFLGFPKGKRGIAAETIGELIIVLAACIIILWIVLGISGYLSPTTASVGCGLNLRVAAATLSHSTVTGPAGLNSVTFLGAPVLMCNQYQQPVDINAANFGACPGIADFCKGAKGDLLEECWQQCARIQIDKLTDVCWTMAGSGKLDFKDTIFAQAKELFTKTIPSVGKVVAGTTTFFILGPIAAEAINDGVTELTAEVLTKAKVLRCFRYRVVNPVIGPDRKNVNYADYSFGRSWAYNLSGSSADKICTPSTSNLNCSFGGEGVPYITDKYNFTSMPQDAVKIVKLPPLNQKFVFVTDVGGYMNYNITDPRNQVCYIAYYQSSSGDFVIRSCKAWNEYAGNAIYIN